MVYLDIVIITLLLIAIVAIRWLLLKNIQLKPQAPPQRELSQAEIAAKSLLYWESLGFSTDDFDQQLEAVDGIRFAMQRLRNLAELRELEQAEANKPAPLPDGVIDINSVKNKF